MDDEDESICSSPTPEKSSRHRRWQCSETTSLLHTCDETEVYQKRLKRIFEADYLDCKRALQQPPPERAVPASEKFMSLQQLLESQQLPSQQFEEITEFAESTSPAMEEETQEEQPANIVEQILNDFCSSPSYLEDAPPTYVTHPAFRFYNKPIRTYSQKSRKQLKVVLDDDDEDDERLSCSSGLSVQEDFITQMPTTKHCDFAANSSQMICENLLNLSAFFTQNNVNNSSGIDLPTDRGETTALVMEEPKDAEDILKDNGYDIGNTEDFRLLDDNEAIQVTVAATVECSLFDGSARLETTLKNKTQQVANVMPNELLDDIPFSEWQPIEVPSTTSELPNQCMDINDCQQLEEISMSEWEPIVLTDSVKLRTASNKIDEGSDQQENTVLTNIDQVENKSSPEFIGTANKVEFRTASNKTVKITDEMRQKAASLMADLESREDLDTFQDQSKPGNSNNQLDTLLAFRTAANKTIELTEEMKKRAAMLMADLGTFQDQCKVESPTVMLETLPGFRTASNKTLQLTDEMQKRAAMLMADLNCKPEAEQSECPKQAIGEIHMEDELLDEIPFSQWQPMELCAENPVEKEANDISSQLDIIPLSEWQPVDIVDSVEFRTASNKVIEVSEEQQQRGAALMAAAVVSTNENCDTNCAPAEQVHQEQTTAEQVQFRTASNKALELTEEMRKRAAMLMADLETVRETTDLLDEVQLKECDTKSNSEYVEFRSASNKGIEVSKEMQQAAKLLLADIDMENPSMPSGNDNRQSENKSIAIKEDSERRAAVPKRKSNRKESNGLFPTEDDHKIITLMPAENVKRKNRNAASPMKEAGILLNTLLPSEDGLNNKEPLKDSFSAATPQPNKLAAQQNNLAFETPKCTPESQVSLTQLSEVSPLDKATKSSIITRRNLLSLNKRRKLKKNAENVDTTQTPMRQRFNPMAAATSTPMPSQQEQPLQEDLQCTTMQKDRRYSQDSPRVQRERVGKRRSEEALSPIYAPTNKTRRLGLSRIRNKSSNNI